MFYLGIVAEANLNEFITFFALWNNHKPIGFLMISGEIHSSLIHFNISSKIWGQYLTKLLEIISIKQGQQQNLTLFLVVF